MNFDRMEKFLKSLDDTEFSCPKCGQTFDAAEGDISQHVVSYWGDNPHNFSCDNCGVDFVVHETVRREYSTSIDEGAA